MSLRADPLYGDLLSVFDNPSELPEKCSNLAGLFVLLASKADFGDKLACYFEVKNYRINELYFFLLVKNMFLFCIDLLKELH